MPAYKVYTIESGKVSEGAIVEKLALKGAGIEIPAIIIGEEGRGRERGVLPVQLNNGQYKEWQEKGRVRIEFAEVGTTKAGKPKLFAKDSADTDEKIICVFRTKIGFRGSNSHTGDKYFVPCPLRGQKVIAAYQCRECGIELMPVKGTSSEQFWAGVTHPDVGEKPMWRPFPGQIIVRGVIAQGAAGRMGSGEQIVAIMPKGIVFRTAYSGRLYGAAPSHYYLWDGKRLLSATWEERMASDLF